MEARFKVGEEVYVIYDLLIYKGTITNILEETCGDLNHPLRRYEVSNAPYPVVENMVFKTQEDVQFAFTKINEIAAKNLMDYLQRKE